jgi:hypothetical protein
MPGSEQDLHYIPAPAVEWHGRALLQNGCGVPAKCRRIAPEGLGARLLTFLLAYRAPTNDTTGLTPASLVFGRELQLSCNLLSGACPNKE